MKINLGSGTDLRAGFVNVDARADVGADVVCDIGAKLPFKTETACEIVAQDVLEHLTLQQQKITLGEIHRVLEPAGKLIIRIPNVDAIWTKFEDDPDTRNLFLYGDTSTSGVWGAHKSGHTDKSFVVLCTTLGFKVISQKNVDTNYEFEFERIAKPEIKKILFVNQTLGIGGAESFNLGLISHLRQMGLIVETYVTNKRFAKMLGPDTKMIPVVLDVIGNWKGLVKAAVLWPYGLFVYWFIVWTNRDADVVFMTGYIEKILVTPMAYLVGLPVVWVEFAPMQTIFKKFFGLPKLLYRLVSWIPDYLIEPTQNTRQKNTNILHVSTGRTKVIPCGLDIDAAKYAKIKPKKYKVCCVSRIEKGKGQDILMNAWPKVLAKFPTAQLYIVGEGDTLPKTVGVHLTGRVPDALKYMAESEICVFPSVWALEGFGLVMLEAMALGRPVIAFNQGTAPEIIDAVLTTPDKLADSIIKILSDSALAKKLGAAGRLKYINNFTMGIVAPQYLHTFLLAKYRHES